MTNTQVAEARIELDGSDVELTVSVWRFNSPTMRYGAPEPLAADVPADLRAALRAWLDKAEQ